MKHKQLVQFSVDAKDIGETLAGEYLYAVESNMVERTDSDGNNYKEDIGGRVKLYRMGKIQVGSTIESIALNIPHVDFLLEPSGIDDDVIVFEGVQYENTDVPVSTAKAVLSLAKIV